MWEGADFLYEVRIIKGYTVALSLPGLVVESLEQSHVASDKNV